MLSISGPLLLADHKGFIWSTDFLDLITSTSKEGNYACDLHFTFALFGMKVDFTFEKYLKCNIIMLLFSMRGVSIW